MKEALIKAIKETTNGVQRMSLKKGKKMNDGGGVSTSNIISKKRRKEEEKHVTFDNIKETTFKEDDLRTNSKSAKNMYNDTYGSGKIPKNYSESYESDEDDVGKTRSSDAESETTFGYSTSEIVQEGGEDIEDDMSDSGKMGKNYSNVVQGREAIFEENAPIMVQNHAENQGKDILKHGKMAKNYSKHGIEMKPTFSKHKTKSAKKMAKGKHKLVAKVGDLVSVPPEIFDDEPGSYSSKHPERCYGTVSSIDKKGIAKVLWVQDGSSNDCKLRDLTVVKRKFATETIVAMLIEGNKVAFAPKDKNDWPKDFFEVLVRSDWRKWVEAVKKEIAGWDDNNAVELVNVEDVPASAKIVPLGELYTIKRNGTYKFRQYLMGNLLRPGLDYQDNYSTTISSTGTTTFFSLATTSGKVIHGWDAVCGYLQTKEQFDIYCYLPTHEGYSNLEYEEIAELRKVFLKIKEAEGMDGIKNFARKHRKEYRANPKQVYKCNSSIYGNLSAGAEFEKLMHHAHIQVAGMTQTQPEPSMFVKIKVDENDVVIGYLIVIAFVDDVRMFGTDPELEDYKRKIMSCMKVKFDELPVPEFVGIQTYQDLERGTCELKMPNYWNKAKTFFQQFRDGDFKKRKIPLSVVDETTMTTEPTPEEIAEAKHLPYLQAVGLLSYPASQCKFEIRYAVSLVGSRRSGWSREHFNIVVKVFEYALTTCEMGLIYSNGLDPHGINVLYAFADANHRVPRPQHCSIVMMNGAATSMTSKKQTKSAPSSTWAEQTSLFQCSTDVLGLRNLMTELGMHQEYPTKIYQDNKSTIQIANNRGSLGKTSRAMDLEILATRNRIEDHEISTEFIRTIYMAADIGTKALTVQPFTMLRDTMNGYALVRAQYPDAQLPSYVYEVDSDATHGQRGSKIDQVQTMIMQFEYDDLSEPADRQSDEHDDSMLDEEPIQRLRGGCPNNDDNDVPNDIKPEELETHHIFDIHNCEECQLCNQGPVMIDKASQTKRSDDNQSSDLYNMPETTCRNYSKKGYCKWGTNCQSSHRSKRHKKTALPTAEYQRPAFSSITPTRESCFMGTTKALHQLTRNDKEVWNDRDEWLIIKVPKKDKEIFFVDYCDGDSEDEFHWLEGPYLQQQSVNELLNIRRARPRSSRRRRGLTEFRDDPELDSKNPHGYEFPHKERTEATAIHDACEHEVSRLRGGADESTADYYDTQDYQDEQDDESQMQYDDTYDENAYEQGTVHQDESMFDPDNIFSMKLDPTIPGVGYDDEFDDLPDPRLYNVDMKEMLLYVYIFIHTSDDDDNHPFFNYERYVRLIDQDKDAYQETIDTAWKSLEAVDIANEPLRLVHILGPQFSSDPDIRAREIKIALERYIRQAEPTIYASIEQRFQDNVDWDPFTKYPRPKASFLRWHRWRCYFRNRLLHFTSEKFKATLWTTFSEVPEGPPLWRPIDEARTRKRDWFILRSDLSQYQKLNHGFDDDNIPIDINVPNHDIVFWEQVPLWHRPTSTDVYGYHDENLSFFQPVTRHWNEAYLTPVRDDTPRGTRLSLYLHRPNSTWGRVAQKIDEAHAIAWGTGYNSSAPFNDGWGSEDTPSAPKKQKVEHKEESSDDSNVEPKAT